MESSLDLFFDTALKIVLSTLLGGMIGAEREYKGKNIGFRTIILICLGSTLFTILSIELGKDHDPTRIASNILTGIGFLGAGAIFREGVNIKGMTTATIIWISAAIGMACGIGDYWLATSVTLIVMIVLVVFARIQRYIDTISQEKLYKIGISRNPDLQKDVEQTIRNFGLKINAIHHAKQDDKLKIEYEIRGPEQAHLNLLNYLSTQQFILEFEA